MELVLREGPVVAEMPPVTELAWSWMHVGGSGVLSDAFR